jgi:hypothetical protein
MGPNYSFVIRCACGSILQVKADWVDWPLPQSYTCANCGRNFFITTYKGNPDDEDSGA